MVTLWQEMLSRFIALHEWWGSYEHHGRGFLGKIKIPAGDITLFFRGPGGGGTEWVKDWGWAKAALCGISRPHRREGMCLLLLRNLARIRCTDWINYRFALSSRGELHILETLNKVGWLHTVKRVCVCVRRIQSAAWPISVNRNDNILSKPTRIANSCAHKTTSDTRACFQIGCQGVPHYSHLRCGGLLLCSHLPVLGVGPGQQ